MSTNINSADIVSISIQAVAKVFLVVGMGAAAQNRGLLGPKFRQDISKFNYFILLPCYIFTSMGASLSLEVLKRTYILPLFCTLNCLLSAVCAMLLYRSVFALVVRP